MKTMEQHEARLSSLFGRLTRTSLVGAAVLATACSPGSDEGSPATNDVSVQDTQVGSDLANVDSADPASDASDSGPDQEPFDPARYGPICDQDDELRLLDDDAPGLADGVAVYEFGDIGDHGYALRDSAGTVCGGAADPIACQAAVEDELSSSPGGSWAILETKGDAIQVFRGKTAPTDWSGKPDSTADAVLIALSHGLSVSCFTTETSRGGIQNTADGWIVLGTTHESCPSQVWAATAAVDASGHAEVTQGPTLRKSDGCAGRRPSGLVANKATAGRHGLGPFLAATAELEAASVPAFAELALDLELLGAPSQWVALAYGSAHDEVRHADTLTRLALAEGTAPAPVTVRRAERRTLLGLALDNAVEGCVRETWGAFLASHQAAHAEHPGIAAAMASIARDETRHAALAWSISDWVLPKLDAEEHRAVIEARSVALDQIATETDGAVEADVRAASGLPPLNLRAGLFATFRRELLA